MTAQANPKLALRPYLPADARLLAEIFRASVEELAADDYSDTQREVWAAVADDEGEFGARLAQGLTLVATLGGSVVGFVSLKGADEIDLLYVHPAVAGQGIGAMLCDAVEKLAGSRGTARLVTDASDSARGFFEKRGYVAQQRNTVSLGGEWLANTTMEKRLAVKASRS
jgi:putative acetyltransferase